MQSRLVLLLLVASTAVFGKPITVESPAPGISKSGRLIERVGIETLGGVFTPLTELGCQIPCSVTKVFSTADDNQAEISLMLYRGTSKMVEDAKRLGKFVVIGVPPLPRGQPKIAITFKVLRNRIMLEAVNQQTGIPLDIERREP